MEIATLYNYKILKANKNEMITNLKEGCHAQKIIKKSKRKEFLIVKGSTEIAGYMVILAGLSRKYKDLKVLLAGKDLSVFSI